MAAKKRSLLGDLHCPKIAHGANRSSTMATKLPDDALDQLFRKARSYNGYLNRPVSENHLREIWDLMKYGPTSANLMPARIVRSEEHTSELQSLMRISYAVFCLKKKKKNK